MMSFLAMDPPRHTRMRALVSSGNFGATDAVGRTFSMWGGTRVLTIVGVVGDVPYRRIGALKIAYRGGQNHSIEPALLGL